MAGMAKITDGTRSEQLKELLIILADEIDKRPGARDLAQLSKQYRETLKEIEELKGAGGDGDEIEEILSRRESDGQSRAVR